MKVLVSATLFVMATALFVSAYCYAESSPEPLKIGVLNDQSGPYARYTKGAVVRTDGRVLRDMYLLQAKAPSETKSEWDLYTIVARIPPEEAFRSLAESGCPLAK